jgi:hypothetical protein
MPARKVIDKELLFKIARLGCSQEECADIVGCSVDTLHRRYADVLASARASRNLSIRRAQMVRAIKYKSDRMLIYLGQIYCGQKVTDDEGGLSQILAGILAEHRERKESQNGCHPAER